MSSRIQKGFTLIELLIVVAIIAILAAIAVPNFLEAQVRSKVSRTKADQRTIATALESYRVDYNHYPGQGEYNHAGGYPYASDVTRVWGGESPRHAANLPTICWPLSTPIAYLSSTQSTFKDPFFKGWDPANTSVVNDTRFYNYSGDYVYGRIYDSTQDLPPAQQEQAMHTLNELNHWHLRGRGPDGSYSRRSQGWEDFLKFHGAAGTGTGGAGGWNAIYDATNGTVSFGDVVRLGTLGVVN